MSKLHNLSTRNLISPVPFGAEGIVLSEIAASAPSGLLHIAIDDKHMDRIAHFISYFAPSVKIIQIPAWDCLPYDRVSPAAYIASGRTKALAEIAAKPIGKNTIVITTVNSLLQRVVPREIISSMSFIAHKGDKISRDDLVKFLVRSGYINSPTANESGEFALRGSIIDLIPSGSETGYRLDFFGDELDSIRKFDPLTQISEGALPEINIVPASEVILDDKSRQLFRDNYRQHFGIAKEEDPLYEAITNGRQYAGMEHWLPFFYENLETIFDYLPGAYVSFDHLVKEARDERLVMVDDYYKARKDNKNMGFTGGDGYKPVPPEMMFIGSDIWDKRTAEHKEITISNFRAEATSDVNFIETDMKPVRNFSVDAKTTKENAFQLMANFLAEARLEASKKQIKPKKPLITCFSEGSRERLMKMLGEYDIFCIKIDKWQDAREIKGKTIGLTVLELDDGFETGEYTIISEQDILGERMSIKQASRKKSEKFIMEAASLAEGELVVHKDHGIGRFEALETLNVSGQQHDCLRIVYHGGDKLYVPVENIDALARYGSDEEGAQLDKLGSASWQGRKAKFKKRIKDIAEGLMKIAAERALKTAPEIIAEHGTYEEFCARFPYNETDDQLRCIEEVAEDLASGKPMDRLICGDVGFGKTEVALRAAFLAAAAGMQVAVIAPTTILARQHYNNFKARFNGFAFEVRDLSRFTKPADAKQTKILMEEGRCDIVVGTHALLAKSVKFKNLGLVIIDEEQQFGVVQKERFKEFRSNIHMLALSATPIPRTLQMSLAGIKDLSIIATPPVDRLAIRSYTMPFDAVVIRNAILREYYRGGKTFFVVPRIKDLEKLETKMKELVPEIKITHAHGQMPPDNLDKTMNDFYDGKYDMLLSTNIIGSGIDLPSANTIIIYKADMFGLAQLYQMRGRVGRSKIRAYAYFTTEPRKVPSKTALQRLDVMQHLDALGAGFSLASHDMDIRGFGNLVGDEQSGHIKEVGVELYQEMLQEAITKVKQHREESEEDDSWSPNINLGIPVLIPESYVKDLELRLGLYRRIAGLETPDELDAIAAEMIDRFGKLPEEVENLLEIMRIKQMCLANNVEKVDAGPKGIVIGFYNNKCKNPEALIKFVNRNPLKTKIRGDQKLVFMLEAPSPEIRLAAAKNALSKIAEAA